MKLFPPYRFWMKIFALLAIIVGSAHPASGTTAKPVAVVVGTNAPEMEKFAARELCGYLEKLFGIKVTPTPFIPPNTYDVFLVGSPETNPFIQRADFPKVTDQGVVLQRVPQTRTFIVGGGSPKATLWAVYELAEKWGVRFLLHNDVLPAPRGFTLPDFKATEEPVLRVRQWRVLNEHAMGPISWGMADYKPVIDQLAKLRFNRLLLYIWPGQPFLPLSYKGIKQTSGTLFFGHQFPITDDMIGRSLFGGEKEFWNPDLPFPGDPEKLTTAAVKHVQSLMAYAHERGMECVLPASLTEFPKEFKPLLTSMHPVDMTGTPTIGPGADANVDDPVLTGLARAVLETTLKTYPDVEYIALDLPEWRALGRDYERAWKNLDSQYHLTEIRSLNNLVEAAKKRTNYPGGADRAVSELKADIVALYFYDRFIHDPQLSAGRKFILSSVAEELYPLLARILPPGSETLNFVDYTPSRIVQRREVLRDIPARSIPSVLIYTLHDDNVGVLPQLATHSLAALTTNISELGWAGFSTRYWLTGDHDPCVAYLARAAWDTNTSPDKIYRDQIEHVCGAAAVPDMLTVFREVEAATVTLEWHGLGLTFPTANMILQHWTPNAMSPELQSVTAHYETALAAAKRALGKSDNEYVRYWVGRLEFGIDYMKAIDSVHTAVRNHSAPTEAVELIKQGITAYAGVAKDRSDKGAIATMNEFVYQPLRAKVAAAPAVHAVDFQSRKVYQSKQHPSYTSWVSFFPGEHGQWYLGCEEVTTPATPQTRASKEFVYGMSLPRGYDKSKYLMELVLLESNDNLTNWQVISREPVKASGGSFAQARTKDKNFLRFVWAGYSTDTNTTPDEIFYRSSDNGKTWQKQKPFVSGPFVWYPHRLRTLRDGTLVLCVPRSSRWGAGTEYPIRASMKLNTVSDTEMMLFFSFDQGKTWAGPTPILSGQNVSETDFVELPDGNLLFFNNCIFATPGRQMIYRAGHRLTPGPLERVHSGTVPETVCLTDDGILIGAQRPGTYHWSDDLGQNWHALEGVPSTMEVYQPWIQYLGHGRVACAGHLGADDPIHGRDQYISVHTFKVEVSHKTRSTKLWIKRGYDPAKKNFLNSYAISLSSENTPLANKPIQVWYVARDAAGYDSWNSKPLEERMKAGGKVITVKTGPDGHAQLNLPEFDGIESIHASYQMVIRFNADHSDPDYKSAQLPQLEYYANSGLDP